MFYEGKTGFFPFIKLFRICSLMFVCLYEFIQMQCISLPVFFFIPPSTIHEPCHVFVQGKEDQPVSIRLIPDPCGPSSCEPVLLPVRALNGIWHKAVVAEQVGECLTLFLAQRCVANIWRSCGIYIYIYIG